MRSPALPLAEERDPDYLPFLAVDAPPDLDVELCPGTPALPPEARRLFSAGESWSAHASGELLLIAPHVQPPATGPDWLAAVGPDRRSVRITCGEALLAGSAPGRLHHPVHYPLDQVLLALALAGEGLIFHAAGVDLGGRGVVLAGVSGAGKTTIARLCAAAGHRVLSDDRVIVRRHADGWRLHGTPWPGEGKFVESRAVPLAALVLLSRGEADLLLDPGRAPLARRLLQLASVPWFDRAAAGRCLDLLDALAAAAPLRELAFRPGAGAVRALEAAFG